MKPLRAILRVLSVSWRHFEAEQWLIGVRVQQVSQRVERLRSELDGYDDDLRREWWRE